MQSQQAPRATWTVVSNTDEALIIRDLDAPGCPSITNDAEAVVEYLALPSSKRLLYFDTNCD